MFIVTQIKPQKRPGRYNIYLDGEFAFALDGESLVKSGLAVGQKLSRGAVDELTRLNEVDRLVNKALRFLSFRPRSEWELRRYLRSRPLADGDRKEVKDSLVEAAIGRLRDGGYVDDAAFVRWWVEQRRRGKAPLGGRRIRSELFAKGVPAGLVDQALASGGNREMALAQRAAQKKVRLYKNLKPREFRRKMGAYLARRGFSWEVAKTVIDTLAKTP